MIVGFTVSFWRKLPPNSMIAVEASGHYSWLVDEMERQGHQPKLANPLEAKRRMGLTNKSWMRKSQWHSAGSLDSAGRVDVP
jgi:hypothetical protein